MNYGKFYDLPYHEKYKISSKGYIYNLNDNTLLKPIKINKEWHVTINDEYYNIAKLVLSTFIGDIPGEINYLISKDNYGVKDLCYNIIIEWINDNTIIINGIKFLKIAGFSKYYISDNGVVYSITHHKLIVKTFNHRGYPTVGLVDNNGFRSPRKVHRLVYMTYIGKLKDGYIIDHKNGLKYCSDYWNLEQIVQRENVMRAYELGLNNTRRWADSDIELICSLLEKNTPSREIFCTLGMTSHNEYRDLTLLIHNIINGILYRDISHNYDISKYISELNKKDRKLSIDDVKDIKRMLLNGNITIKAISEKYNCTTSTITKIRDSKTWKNVFIDLSDMSSTTIES
jgi:Trp operon repressor